MIKRWRIRGTAGDTIVEVLIVLAVLGLAFSTAYAIASRGLGQSRNAQEHSEAVGVISTQVEQIKAAIEKKTDVFKTVPFCMTGATTISDPFGTGYTAVDPNAATDDFTKYPTGTNGCVSPDGRYYTSITYTPASADPAAGGLYDVRVRWDGINGLPRQQVEMTYRTYPLSATTTQGIPLSAVASQIKVKVSKIPVTAGNTTPACSASATQISSGASTIKLRQTESGLEQTHDTDSSSTWTFTNNIIQNGHYAATITAVPAGHRICPPNPSSPAVSPTTADPTPQIDMKIYPQVIRVKVYKIPPNSDNTTPNCGNAATQPATSGIAVKLKQLNGAQAEQTVSTDSTSFAVFSQNIDPNGTYNATVTAPANYKVCAPNPSAATGGPIAANTTPQIDTKLQPQCTTETYTTRESRTIHHSDLVYDYGWVLTSSAVRSPNGYHWTSSSSPGTVSAGHPAYRSGWTIATQWTDSTHYQVAWFSYAGWYYLYVYDDWWDYYAWQITGSHYNNWDETQYYDQTHTRNVCP